ncbi:hypothetical protein ACMAUO_06050 [Gluconacetobacter sp. Hr-1-5]|uniref:hypothetical protein n=1 Tax=Gluconacetobacter sp. Hr-1-5 TaxID=3395370 RepID=UPI003B520DD4
MSDMNGQSRALSPQEVGMRSTLMSLFYGDDKWLRATFPMEKPVKIRGPHGKLLWTRRVVDFDLSKARDWIVSECVRRDRVAHAGGV